MGDPHVVLDLRHILFCRGLFGERPRQHELGLEYCPGLLYDAVESRCHPRNGRMLDVALDIGNTPAGVALVPGRLRPSVATPSCTLRLPDRSSGSTSPRLSRQRRSSAASSLPMMIRASD